MNQFDIYVNPIAKGRKRFPYVCSLQNKLFDGLTTRIVAFICSDESIAFDKIEESRLKEFVENISDNREALLAAHDALFTGI